MRERLDRGEAALFQRGSDAVSESSPCPSGFLFTPRLPLSCHLNTTPHLPNVPPLALVLALAGILGSWVHGLTEDLPTPHTCLTSNEWIRS